jgi:hypothetical protein
MILCMFTKEDLTMKKPILFILCAAFLAYLAIPHEGHGDNTVYLEGLYATSTAIDYEKYGPHHLFDGKPDYWATMPGAAPDEGIMMYFAQPTKINSLKIDLPADPKMPKIRALRVYANGTDKGVFQTNTPIFLDTQCSSLYLRIIDCDGTDYQSVASDMKDFKKQTRRFKPKSGTGIAEISLLDGDGSTIRIVPPALIKGTIAPGSTLKPEEAYHAGYLFDSRRNSGWVEGKSGSGKGETIGFTFNKPVTIAKLRLWNGLLISDVHYSANERVKSFDFSSGNDSAGYTIPDSMSAQTVTLKKPLKGTGFTFTIKEIYPGTKYKDTVISELLFHDGTQWFSLYSDEIERRKKELLEKIKGTVLEQITDRFIGETYLSDMSAKNKSILLRSDSSFVIYIEDEDGGPDGSARKTRILDGFWNIVSVAPDKTVVTILGRNYNLAEQFVAYEGNSTTSAITIFSDTLTITKNRITGKKFFGSIGF